jgi:proteasome beta subunit
MGNRISNREMEKVVSADKFSGVAISGTAGVAMDMIKIFQLQIEHYEKLDGRSISLEGKANQLSQMVKSNLPAAMQGLAVLPIFAGYDELRRSGRLWDFDITGGRYEEKDFVATGSGGGPASTVLKVGFRPSLTADQAIDLACEALWEAADVDSATGGPDALREIYPTVATISEIGWSSIDDETLRMKFEAISARHKERREGRSS